MFRIKSRASMEKNDQMGMSKLRVTGARDKAPITLEMFQHSPLDSHSGISKSPTMIFSRMRDSSSSSKGNVPVNRQKKMIPSDQISTSLNDFQHDILFIEMCPHQDQDTSLPSTSPVQRI